MIPLTVRAHLATGIAVSSWGISLDGLLAAILWSQRKAAARDRGEVLAPATEAEVPEDLELPLARCELAGDLWHWAATTAWPEPTPQHLDVHTWTGRVDHRELEQVATQLPKVVSARQGRYRTRRMPLVVIPCRAVSWQCVGDPGAIEDLLSDLVTIGKKRTSGEGHVLRWEITPSEQDQFAAGHLHLDGALGRPTPPECLNDRELAVGGVGSAGIRPPYRHPLRQHDLLLPTVLA